MNYTEDARYYQFLIENTIEAEKLRGFTKTLFAANEGASITSLYAIQEDVGDKIRNIWDKFIAFINRVWAKFMDYANRVIQSDKGYLEKYKEVILNKAPNDVDIQMRNYANGIHNMTQVMIPPFIGVQDKMPTDSADASFKQQLIPAYKDLNQDWSSFCTAYFQGGPDKIDTNLKQLNMTDLYNYCHDYSKIEAVIKKDQTTITETFNSVQGEITKAKTAAKQPPAQQQPTAAANPPAKPAATTPPAQGTDTDTQKQPVQGGKQIYDKATGQWKPQESTSAVIDSYMTKYFTEGDGMTIGTKQANTTSNSNVTTGDTTKAANNMKSAQAAPTAPDGSTTPPANTGGNVDLDDLEKKIAQYNDTAGGVLTAKMTSAHVIYQDYMKIIKLHVGQQVGKDGDSKVAQAGSNYDQGLFNSPQDAEAALKTIAQADAEQDKNKKNQLIQSVISQAKSANPNFNGGLEDVRKAAVAASQQKPAAKPAEGK